MDGENLLIVGAEPLVPCQSLREGKDDVVFAFGEVSLKETQKAEANGERLAPGVKADRLGSDFVVAEVGQQLVPDGMVDDIGVHSREFQSGGQVGRGDTLFATPGEKS